MTDGEDKARARAAAGDPVVPDYGQMRRRVLGLLRAELRDPALADDLCHETLRIVLERLARRPLEDPARLDGYAIQTARVLAMDHRRREARRRTATGLQTAIDAAAHPADDPAEAQLVESRAQAVRKLLQEMRSPRDREILVRVYLYDQDKQQVCLELQIDEAHYKRVLHRARERFAVLVQRQYRRGDLFCIALI